MDMVIQFVTNDDIDLKFSFQNDYNYIQHLLLDTNSAFIYEMQYPQSCEDEHFSVTCCQEIYHTLKFHNYRLR